MSSSNMFRISAESDHLSDASTKCPTTDSDKNIAGETDNESSASEKRNQLQLLRENQVDQDLKKVSFKLLNLTIGKIIIMKRGLH